VKNQRSLGLSTVMSNLAMSHGSCYALHHNEHSLSLGTVSLYWAHSTG